MRPTSPHQWHLHGPWAATIPQRAVGIDAIGAWAQLGHVARSDVVVGLVDDSCWLGVPGLPVPALPGAAAVTPRGLRVLEDLVGSDADLLTPPGRTHGTSMATLIAARGPDALGVAPGVRLWPVVLGGT